MAFRQNNHQRNMAYNRHAQYADDEDQPSYGNMKSNFQKYQNSVAKDEYCKTGYANDASSAIYDSMQFLSMKREKSMYNHDESSSYLKREKSNPLLKYHTKNPRGLIDSNEFELEPSTRVRSKINNNFSNETFIVKSKHPQHTGNLHEDVSMNNLL